jgi:anti-sigma B factor antagonist
MTHNYTPHNHISVMTTHAAAVPIVHIAGEIDLATCDWIAEDVFEALATHPPGVVIDLSDVQFIGSAGLALLIEANQRAEQMRADLRLVASHQPVLRPLQVAGLTDLFRLHPSISAAVTAVTDHTS